MHGQRRNAAFLQNSGDAYGIDRIGIPTNANFCRDRKGSDGINDCFGYAGKSRTIL